jgi:hypothetical protein
LSVVTEAAMQHVKEPHARLPRDQETDATMRAGRVQEAPAQQTGLYPCLLWAGPCTGTATERGRLGPYPLL